MVTKDDLNRVWQAAFSKTGSELKAYAAVVKHVTANDGDLFDRVCDVVEGSKTHTTGRPGCYVTTCWHHVHGHIPAWEARTYPRAAKFFFFARRLLE